MSKKSRKRNRKILGALAALGTGLALANRGKGTEMSNISVDSGRGSGLRPVNVAPKRIYNRKSDMMRFPNVGVAVGVDREAGPFERSRIGSLLQGTDRSPVDRLGPDIPEINYMRKGGRVGCGVAKKGFGKAMKRRKK